MMMVDEHYQCPACDGEFFPAEYFKRREDPDYMAAWEWSRRTYWKALRDERETARVSRKVARLAGI
jgi:hypothetical protein